MRKIFYLSTCSTCTRILKEINYEAHGFELQDIKSEKITGIQLEHLKQKAGSFEALFSRTAMKYRSLGLNTKQLNEEDYRKLILEEYTFLKRPVIVIDNQIFIGNSKSTIAAAMMALGKR